MAKTAAERKAAQRARQRKGGIVIRELQLEPEEEQMAQELLTGLRPGREPYDFNEVVGLLIRRCHAEYQQKLSHQQQRSCKKCGDKLPVKECPCVGDASCWLTLGWHETKLTV
ncbi:hypothetical protein ACUNHK_02100 [Serratia sp. IR-2025]|nr:MULTISPECIES: hypothetical protein [Serratia]MBN5438890.1 hypothetical protein [Serratia marcescens]MDR8480760.1 hypothetical protein [Serratia nevei]PHY66367.1 hypothetical protein CS368_19675 [Serratia marcescens]HAT2882664.1 hypothetical protein [Serratia marcescens]HEJ9180349.1 hypothetical protein [Serratia marcescens]